MHRLEAKQYPATFREGVVPLYPESAPLCLTAAEQLLAELSQFCEPLKLFDLEQSFPLLLRGEVVRNFLHASQNGASVTRYFYDLSQKLHRPESLSSSLLDPRVIEALRRLSKGMDIDVRFQVSPENVDRVTVFLSRFTEAWLQKGIIIQVTEKQLRSSRHLLTPRKQWTITLSSDTPREIPISIDLGELPRDNVEVHQDERLGFKASLKSSNSITGLVPTGNNLNLLYPSHTLYYARKPDTLTFFTMSATALLKILNSWALHEHEGGFSDTFLDIWEMAVYMSQSHQVYYEESRLPEFIKQMMLMMVLNPVGFLSELDGFDGLLRDTSLSAELDIGMGKMDELVNQFREFVQQNYSESNVPLDAFLKFFQAKKLMSKRKTLAELLNSLLPKSKLIKSAKNVSPEHQAMFAF